MRRAIICLCSLTTLASLAIAETYVVNPEGTGDFPTIQAAIDSAQDGDVIELSDGVFSGDGNRDVFWDLKAITVKSQSGDPQACIIDCQGSPSDPHRAFTVNYVAEHPWAALDGISIKNGYADCGGGILLVMSSPMIRNCILLHNSALYLGGGIDCDSDSRPQLTRCTFIGNAASNGGGLCM